MNERSMHSSIMHKGSNGMSDSIQKSLAYFIKYISICCYNILQLPYLRALLYGCCYQLWGQGGAAKGHALRFPQWHVSSLRCHMTLPIAPVNIFQMSTLCFESGPVAVMFLKDLYRRVSVAYCWFDIHISKAWNRAFFKVFHMVRTTQHSINFLTLQASLCQ
jgi:hypothetical protein